MNQKNDHYKQIREMIDTIETTSKLIGHPTLRTGNTLRIYRNNKNISINLLKDYHGQPTLNIYGEAHGSIHFLRDEFDKQMKYLQNFLEKL